MPTPVQRIRSNALRTPGQAALFGPVKSGWRQLSWGAWWASIRQAAGGLIDIGVPPACKVLLWAPTVPEWAVLWPAISAVGAIPVLLPPGADDPELVLALSDEDLRHVVVGGRERAERLLVCREGGIDLDRIVSLDRLGVRAPRIVDLDGLIERGAGRLEDVERRVGALKPTGIAAELPDGRLVHHDELIGDPGSVSGVGLAADPASRAAVAAIAAAVTGHAELWMATDPARLLDGLAGRGLDRLCLDPEVLWERERRNTSFISGSADPQRMLANFMHRSLWRNDLIATEAEQTGLSLMRLDGSESVDALVDRVFGTGAETD